MPEQHKPTRQEAMRNNVERMTQAWAAEQDALLIVRQFNARLSASKNKSAGFWPTIGAALDARHPWVEVLCESCQTIGALDLRMKPRSLQAPLTVILDDVRCPLCEGARHRIVGLRRFP
jgi:hypothetical protein